MPSALPARPHDRTRMRASRLLLPRSGLERSDFVRWPIATFRCVVESGRYQMTADLTCSGACHGTVRTAAAGERTRRVRLPVAFGKSSTAWRVARSISNLTGGPVFFCRVSGDRLRTRRQPHPRLFINPPAGPASDHVRLRHGVPGLAFWRQCRVLPPTRNLPALASSLAGRRSGSTGRGEASSRLTGTIGWMLRQRPANFQAARW